MDYVDSKTQESTSALPSDPSIIIPNEPVDHEPDAKGFGISMPGFLSPKKPKAVMPTEKYAIEYNMSHLKRGRAIIFNNKLFDQRLNLNERRGTDSDRDNFYQSLLHLGFTADMIEKLENSPKRVIIDTVRKVAMEDHKNNDCVVIAIFSHGDSGCIYGCDGKLNPEELWEPFLGNKCLSLAGKPKLFFIQACRGDRLDNGEKVKPFDLIDGNSETFKIPSYADILISYSTVPGFYSWRNTTDGSWYIQALSMVFQQFGHEHDLMTLLTLVNQKVAYDFESYTPNVPEMNQKKQIPCISSMLTRKVLFKPKHTQSFNNHIS